MKAIDIKNEILLMTNDVVFSYNKKIVCINPWGLKKFVVGYDDKVKEYNNIEDLMSDPFYDGKSLNEIAHEIIID